MRRFLNWLFGRRPPLHEIYRRDKAATLFSIGSAGINHDNRNLKR